MRKDWMALAYSQETVTSNSAISVLLAIAKHADEAKFCHPSVERLSALSRLDPRTVQRQIKALEALDLVRRESGGQWMHKSGGANQGRASFYQHIAEPDSTALRAENHSGAVPPKTHSTPAPCHLGNQVKSNLPWPSDSLT